MASTEAESQALPTTTKVRILVAIAAVHDDQKRLEVLRMVGEVLSEEEKTTPAPPTARTFEDALKSVAVYVPAATLAAPLPHNVRIAFNEVLMALGERPEIQAASTPTAPLALSPIFTDMSEAYEALRKDAVPRAIDEFGLTKHVRYNKDRIYGAFYTGVTNLLRKCFKKGADKCFNYQMCVVATPGQGKTDTLLCIRYDLELRQELIKKINECQQHVTCLHVVPLFATFNSWSNYKVVESDFIEAALCHRLLLDYVGSDSTAFEFDSTTTPRFANLTLQHLLAFVQEKESEARGCAPSQVCVIFLVDEVLKVGSKTQELCNAFNSTQCSAMLCGKLCFSVVSCLQVDTIYTAITTQSGRPLHTIPLLPCSAKDTNNFLNELFRKCPTLLVQDKQTIRWRAHGCNGHFRSLDELWNSVVEQERLPPDGPISSESSACFLEIIAKHLTASDSKGWMGESTKIGALFSASNKASIHDIVFSGEGVHYRDVFPGNVSRKQKPMILPCVSPLLLTRRKPCHEDTVVAQNIVNILPRIFRRLHMPKEVLVKTWEIAIPLLEAVAATMIREASRGRPVALKDVLKGVVVQHWKTRQIELQYTSNCETCYTSWVEPKEEDEKSVLEDDKALKSACASKSATLCTAINVTYPGIEGVHTMLEATSAQGVPIPVVFQMKTWKVVEWNKLEKWIAAGHKRAQEILELKEGEYFFALYITQSAQQDWKHKIPEGTIVIDQPVLELLLSPFGTSTLLQLVQEPFTSE